VPLLVDGGVAAEPTFTSTVQPHVATLNLQLCKSRGVRCQASARYHRVAPQVCEKSLSNHYLPAYHKDPTQTKPVKWLGHRQRHEETESDP